MRHMILFIGVFTILMAGCETTRRSAVGGDILCIAKLQKYNATYWWSEDSEEYHADYVSPLAEFVIIKPSRCKSRDLKIIFRSSRRDNWLPLFRDGVGKEFQIGVPVSFFQGEAKIIEATDILSVQQSPNRRERDTP